MLNTLESMLILDLSAPIPTSPQQALAQYEQKFHDALATGQYTPFIYPYNAFGLSLLILYLYLPPSKSSIVYYARYPLFAIIILSFFHRNCTMQKLRGYC